MVLCIRFIRRYALMTPVSYREMTNLHFPGMLASPTRELHFHQEKLFWVRPPVLAPYLMNLAHFTNVTTLVFSNLVLSAFHSASISHCFGSFAACMQRLRLHHPFARPTSLVQMILLCHAPDIFFLPFLLPLLSSSSRRQDFLKQL